MVVLLLLTATSELPLHPHVGFEVFHIIRSGHVQVQIALINENERIGTPEDLNKPPILRRHEKCRAPTRSWVKYYR